MSDISNWITAVLVLTLFSLLYKENRWFSYAEHIYVGIAGGHVLNTGLNQIQNMAVKRLAAGDLIVLVPVVLGLMLYFQLSKKYAWVAKIPMSLLIALGIGVAVRSSVQADIVNQIRATGSLSIWTLNGFVIIVGVVSGVLFFFFSKTSNKQAQQFLTINSKLARMVLMVSFGAGLGNTFLTRVSYATAAFRYVFGNWLGIMKM